MPSSVNTDPVMYAPDGRQQTGGRQNQQQNQPVGSPFQRSQNNGTQPPPPPRMMEQRPQMPMQPHAFPPGAAPLPPPGYIMTQGHHGPPPRRMSGHHQHPSQQPPQQQQQMNGMPYDAQFQPMMMPMMHHPMEMHPEMPFPMHAMNMEPLPMPPHHPTEHAMMHPPRPTNNGDNTPQQPEQQQQQMPHMQPQQQGDMPPNAAMQGSMSPLDHRQPLPPIQGLSPSQLGFPLRESFVHNYRGPPMTMEDMRQFQMKQQAAFAAGAMRQKSPTKIQDAASALLTMGTTTRQRSDDSSSHQGSIDGEHSSATRGFPTRLACPEDEEKLNSMHCFLREQLLEVFLIENAPKPPPRPAHVSENSIEALQAELNHAPPPNSAKNRVGIRCVFCQMQNRIYGQECDAPMAVFYPKSLSELYRLVTSWQRVHLRKCKSLPKHIRHHYQTLRENDKTRGKTHYWVTSAKRIGLKDSPNPSGGIIYDP